MKFSNTNSILLTLALPLAALGCRSTHSANGIAGESFASPDEAFEALASVARQGSMEDFECVLGVDCELSVEPEEEEIFIEDVDSFLALYDEAHHIEKPDSTHALLVVGETDWPFPIPVVQRGGAWSFDVAAGREEIAARQIGEDELTAIEVCRAIGDAQEEYRAEFGHYATRIISSEGTHDGLYWESADSEPQSPIGVFLADAAVEDDHMPEDGDCVPFMGYYFRLLEQPSEGEEAGYAVLAWPAEYGTTGVMSFAMDDRGVVLETDLGDETMHACCKTFRFYEPNQEWGVCAD